VKTPTPPSKSRFGKVSRALPPAGAVHEYQTVAPAVPPALGSFGSPVAATVSPVTSAVEPARGWAAANMSLAGAGRVRSVSENVPCLARAPSMAMR
jgi:hypothetical protein